MHYHEELEPPCRRQIDTVEKFPRDGDIKRNEGRVQVIAIHPSPGTYLAPKLYGVQETIIIAEFVYGKGRLLHFTEIALSFYVIISGAVFSLKLAKLATCLERIRKVIEPAPSTRTGRKLRAAVLHGPCNLKLECIPEEAVRPTQVRVDVHYCGLTGSDVLMWRDEHRRIPEPRMVLGFEVSGTILEMGGLAHEQTGYQVGEEVVVHNYPVCGGLAESCLADYRGVFRLMGRVSVKNAAAVADDYFSALLAMGRRARIQRGECFLVNAKYSRTALAVINLATRVFGAKPIAVCSDARRAELCADLGATVVFDGKEQRLSRRLKEISGEEEVRVIIETEGGPYFQRLVKCLKIEGLIAFLGCVRDRRCSSLYVMSSNYTVFAVAAEHYKLADTLVYRETMEQLLDYRSECVIRPRISAIFGLHRVNDAFKYYMTMPTAKVLIDMKNYDRLTLCNDS